MKQITILFFFFVAIHASPLQRRDVAPDKLASTVSSAATNRTQDVESSLLTTHHNTTDQDSTEQYSTTHSPVERLVQEIVIHNYQDDELFPINSNASVANSSDEDSVFSTPSPVDHQGQNIVLHAHKDEDIVQSVDGVTGGPVIHREIDAIYVKPVVEVVVDVPKVDVTRSVGDVDAVPKDDVTRSVGDVDDVPKDDVTRSVEDVDAIAKVDVTRSVEDVDDVPKVDVTRSDGDVDAITKDDDMAVAESGMVFRPLFRYRQQSRSRIDRNVKRRLHRPRLPYYYK